MSVEYLKKTDLFEFMQEYYWLVAVGLFLVIVLLFAIFGFMCIKRYNTVISEHKISDEDLYDYYKDAYTCCNYRVSGPFVFVNTSRGIICMDKSNILDIKRRRVRHTRKTNYTVNGYTRRTYHSRDYYTYHFVLKTTYGTFKNTVANNATLEELRELF